ncbi:hypothetical protein FNF29_05596 [Cafeteria roenbergensis]|uniref:Uncharacterized protein n=1 Tax=Cafeteria roenbergensis TaxID=33653 RepID=A0A5A8CA26_CAFRO|nr:hypothetical protein FNF29_05596 [Cafeteria roenbergensis]|eukprot:KAA0149976.1 hypothetical protein FNF29_05596 [Cafeteria roenbergensis]
MQRGQPRFREPRRVGPPSGSSRLCDQCKAQPAAIRWNAFALCLIHANSSKAAGSRSEWKVLNRQVFNRQARVVEALRRTLAREIQAELEAIDQAEQRHALPPPLQQQ